MHVGDLVSRYGDLFYLILFAWTFVEGETVVLLAGVGARNGLLNVWVIFAVAWAGSFLGDQLWFYLSRRLGRKMLDRFPAAKPKMASAMALMEKHSTVFILSYRFVYGIRNVASLAIGASNITWGRFAFLNFFSAGIWAAAFTSGGYLAGSAMKHVLGELSQEAGIVMLVLFVGGAGFLMWRHHRQQKLVTAPDNTAAAQTEPDRNKVV